MSNSLALAIDFGSTFTKLRIIDLSDGTLVAAAQSPTTLAVGLSLGLKNGLAQLPVSMDKIDTCYGCSSAAGGLRIVAIGLVRNLTAEAARRAASGAGGKLVAIYAGDLTRADLAEIRSLAPDLIVLAGGTDGGDSRCILTNGTKISELPVTCPVIVAGNREAADEISDILADAQVEHTVVGNVMPSLGVLEPGPCSSAIRQLFIKRITQAKGLADAQDFVGRGLVPTPSAVLEGMALISRGTPGIAGLGDLIGVDVGGATTDIYSVGKGSPTLPLTAQHGLPEPYIKRTVEGDLGVRVNAVSIVEAASAEEVWNHTESSDLVFGRYASRVSADVASLPASVAEMSLDAELAGTAVSIAARRHAGRLEVAYGLDGAFKVQYGKDLSNVGFVIGTGGVLSSPARPLAECGRILAPVSYDERLPNSLLPRSPRRYVDRNYVLFATGLLAEDHAPAALQLALASQIELGSRSP